MRLPLPILVRLVRTAAIVWLAARVALAMIGLGTLYREGLVLFFVIVASLTWVDSQITHRDWRRHRSRRPPKHGAQPGHEDRKGERLGVLEMRRHYSNYFRGLPQIKQYRSILVTEHDPSILFETLEEIRERYSQELVPAF